MFNIEKIRKDFPMIINHPNMVYFDNSATTYKPFSVINAVNDFYTNLTSNVHRGDYNTSFLVSNEYEDTRKVVARFINCDEKEVVFTSGATFGLNQVANYGLDNLKKGDVILTTLSEHASNILPWFNVAKKTGATIKYIKQDNEGILDMDSYKSLMDENVKVVTLAHVSNVLGHINPIKEICEIAHNYNAIVVVDGAQSVPHIKIDVKDLGVDFLAFSAHKMCGPNGIGILYGKFDLLQKLEPLVYGGGSNSRFSSNREVMLKDAPFKFESGTPNVEGVLGMKQAILYLEKIGMDNIHEYEVKLKDYMIQELKKLGNIKLYNPNSDTGIIALNGDGVFAQDSGSFFNTKNICVRSGNHCAK
ncbi:MAG: cysteine desulfurase, partial [Erysipelotrichaceae bacterium]|nr:cysteine desulfurase [Erysipelotrichaceae bacterium]